MDAPPPKPTYTVQPPDRVALLEIRLALAEQKLSELQVASGETNAAVDEMQSTLTPLVEEFSHQGSVLYYIRQRLAEERIGDDPTVAGLRLFQSMDEVARAMGQPEERRIVNEASAYTGEPIERWAWPGATAYFDGDSLFQLNIVSPDYETSFGIRVGDPIHRLAFEERYGYAHYFPNGTSLQFDIDAFGSIQRITFTRDAS
ncbi:hypothetical protein MO973_01915 [Paenibacillus sp. TRM 82003]|nr:hypothetical protein [Paenibacillus sp. TRM 82003]